ncbi:MAG TPA: hypothetical protein VM577_01480 [Anaerovoracaceae bacterium]|nr:hypothetical protein [Anaerovoracaceae bacterium]
MGIYTIDYIDLLGVKNKIKEDSEVTRSNYPGLHRHGIIIL